MKTITPGSLLFGNRPPVVARWMFPHQNMLGDALYPIYIMETGPAEFVDTYSIAATNEHWTPINFEELWADGYQRTNANPSLAALRQEFTVEVELSPQLESRIIRLNDLFYDGYNTPPARVRELVLGWGGAISLDLLTALPRQLRGKRLRDPFDDAIERESRRKPGE